MVTAEVVLRDTRDGKEYSITENIRNEEEDIYSFIWRWTEGNKECDCNRSILCGLEKLPCNSGDNVLELIRLRVDGNDLMYWDDGAYR